MLDFQIVKRKVFFFKINAVLRSLIKKYSTMYCIIHSKTYIFVV